MKKTIKKVTAKKVAPKKVSPSKKAITTSKMGMRLTGKTKVPNIAAMKRRKMITSMD